MKPLSKRSMGVIVTGLLLLALPLSWNMISAKPVKIAGDKMKKVDLVFVDENKIKINGKKTSFENLKTSIEKIVGDDKEHVVFNLRFDESATMGTVSKVQQKLQETGIFNIVYADDSKNEASLVLPSDEIKEKIKKIPKKNISDILINASGKIVVEDQVADIKQLYDQTKKHITVNPNVIFVVRTEKDTRYSDYMLVLKILKKAGAKKVHVGE